MILFQTLSIEKKRKNLLNSQNPKILQKTSLTSLKNFVFDYICECSIRYMNNIDEIEKLLGGYVIEKPLHVFSYGSVYVSQSTFYEDSNGEKNKVVLKVINNPPKSSLENIANEVFTERIIN